MTIEDFTLYSAKDACSMEDLTNEEIELIRTYILDVESYADENTDFFEDRGDEWSSDIIFVYRWIWKTHTLIDICGYFGDVEDGCVYLDGKIIAYNEASFLNPTQECPPDLDITELQHLRFNFDFSCEDRHQHCIAVHRMFSRECKSCGCDLCQG